MVADQARGKAETARTEAQTNLLEAESPEETRRNQLPPGPHGRGRLVDPD